MVWSGGISNRPWTAHVPSPHNTSAEALARSVRDLENVAVCGVCGGQMPVRSVFLRIVDATRRPGNPPPSPALNCRLDHTNPAPPDRAA